VASTLETWVGCHPGRCLLSVDPNIRPFLLPDRPEAVERVRRWLGRAHLIKMSEEDLRWMDPEMGVDGACDVYLAGGASLVVVTRGPGGAILANARGRVHVPAAPGPIEDTVGAGDTFQAALLAGLSRMGALDPAALSGLDGDSLRDLGQWAAQAAGVTCSRAGCQPPTSAELDAFPSPRRSGRTPV
jgi:fructokinase